MTTKSFFFQLCVIHSLHATTQVPPPPPPNFLFYFIYFSFGADHLGIIYDNLIAYVKQIPNHLPPPTPPKQNLLTKIQWRKIQFILKLFWASKRAWLTLLHNTKIAPSYYNWQKNHDQIFSFILTLDEKSCKLHPTSLNTYIHTYIQTRPWILT